MCAPLARFYYRWMMGDDYPEFPWDDDNTPSNETKDEAERFAAEFACDARGDEAVRVILNRIIDAASRAGADGVLPAETVRVECLRATYALAAARSPQDEDHERVVDPDEKPIP